MAARYIHFDLVVAAAGVGAVGVVGGVTLLIVVVVVVAQDRIVEGDEIGEW